VTIDLTTDHASARLERGDHDLFAEAISATQRSITIAELSGGQASLVYVNDAFERMTGYRSCDVLGTDSAFLQGPLTDPSVVAQVSAAVNEGRSITVTMLNYRKDGSTFWNEMSFAPLLDNLGTPTHTVAMQSDVTARVLGLRDLEAVYASERQAHEASEGTTRFLKAVLSQLPVGALIAEAPSGKLLWGNSQLETIFRHPFVAGRGIESYGPNSFYRVDNNQYSHDELPLRRSLQGEVVIAEELSIKRGDGSSGVIVANSTPVHNESGEIIAAVVLFDDITERKHAEHELVRTRERSVSLAQTLQKSLLPADLPVVEGFEFGAAYAPVGEGLDVGGDFYDVFEHSNGEVVLVIGDVMGKGAEAAAVTSFARHALRTAALRERTPSALLSVLNQALLREGDQALLRGSEGRPFVTVASAVLTPTSEGARLTISLGGHPCPFVIDRSGAVRQVGRPGTLMGVTPDVELHDSVVDLVSGDVVVMYTDGATEAHAGNELLGEEGLRAVLTRLAGQGLATGSLAKAIQEEVMILAGSELKDDLALLVASVR